MAEPTQIFIEIYTNKPLEHVFNLTKTDAGIYLTAANGAQNYNSSLIERGDVLYWYNNDNAMIEFSYIDVEQLLILFAAWNQTKIEFRQHVVLKSI